MRGQRPGAFDQLLLLALQHLIRNPALAIPVHQLVQRAPGFVLQQRRRQIERDVLVQILHDLRFLGALDLVLFFVLEIVLHHVPQIGQRFVRHQLRRERIVQLRQHLLFDFVQRDRVVGLLARQF